LGRGESNEQRSQERQIAEHKLTQSIVRSPEGAMAGRHKADDGIDGRTPDLKDESSGNDAPSSPDSLEQTIVVGSHEHV